MNPEQLRLFKRITLDYFAKLAPDDPPVLGEPHIHFGAPELLDYTSLIGIDGEYRGCIYLTAPAAMLAEVLSINGEGQKTAAHLMDMSRELSNVLSGNASKAFGGNWQITVPRSLTLEQAHRVELPKSTFVMPIVWRAQTSLLVIGLTPAQEAA